MDARLRRIMRNAPYWTRNCVSALRELRQDECTATPTDEGGNYVVYPWDLTDKPSGAEWEADGFVFRAKAELDEYADEDAFGEPLSFDEAFGYCRAAGASKGVAREEARKAVERWEWETRQENGAYVYAVTLSVYRRGACDRLVELGAASLGGISFTADTEPLPYLWECVSELQSEAREQADASLAMLREDA